MRNDMDDLLPKQKTKIARLAEKKSARDIARIVKLPENVVAEYLRHLHAARRRRERVFRWLMVAIPILFFAGLELTLRLGNYGGNLALFIPVENYPGYLKVNPNIGSRYFANLRVNPKTSNDVFPVEKAPDAFRIFVLGGSSAYGYPYGHNGSMSKFLLQRLQASYPAKAFEVVNVAMPAINSYSLLDMLDEVLQQQPDALLVYAGHNEYYGALGAGSIESLGGSRAITRLYLKLQRYRTFLLLRYQSENVKRWLASKANAAGREQATLMERMVANKEIAWGSRTFDRGVNQFRANMTDIVRRANDAGVPVYLATLASNLKDQRPFISVATGNMPGADLQQEIRNLQALELTGKPAEALARYRQLAEQDSGYAELYFRMGKCLQTLQRYDAAGAAFRKARDLDALRFRAPGVFNDILRDIAAADGDFLVDTEAAFANASPHGLMGRELFLEHLHPNVRGYFLMGREVAQAILQTGALPMDWGAAMTADDSTLWQRRGVTELDLEVAKIRIGMLTSRWPFVAEKFESAVVYQPQNPLQELAYELWQKKITWEQAHVTAAERYTKQRDFARAAREYEALILETPHNVSPYLRSAWVHIMLNDLETAKARLLASLRIEETAEAHKSLGAILLKQKKAFGAVPHLEKALATLPDDAQLLYNLAGGYMMIGEVDKAERIIERLDKVRPGALEVAMLKSDLINLRRRQQAMLAKQENGS